MSEKLPSENSHPYLLPQLLPEAGSPYDALAEFGAHFDASMQQIHQSGLNAQRHGSLDHVRRKAWQKLRNSEARLLLDLFHVHPDPAAFGEEARPADSDPRLQPPRWDLPVPPPPPRAIAQALGDIPAPPEPAPLQPGDPPPFDTPLWALIAETWGRQSPQPPPWPEPESFLEDES